MKIMVLGACGTFMAGVVVLAKQLGHDVVAYDEGCYPPMSTQLQAQGVVVQNATTLALNHIDLVVIGNGFSRSHTWVRQVLRSDVPYTSGPAWLFDHVLQRRHVIAIAGTHGKTTTTGMTVWILAQLGMRPGFLIGGMVEGMSTSANLGHQDAPFVIEADEYDSAFFDKRAKFLHYRPKTLVINRLEHDHVDIYPTMQAMLQPFKTLLQTVPDHGCIIDASESSALSEVVATHAFAPVTPMFTSNAAKVLKSLPNVGFELGADACVSWRHVFGAHNDHNGALALMAVMDVGVSSAEAARVLSDFPGVAKRLQKWPNTGDVDVYEDFAHHPTAMRAVLTALHRRHPNRPIKVLLQLGSYTQRAGVHWPMVAAALKTASGVWMLRPSDTDSDVDVLLAAMGGHAHLFNEVRRLAAHVQNTLVAEDVVVIMSSRDFDGIRDVWHVTTELS